MTYEAWRISYQSSEQAARAAYAKCVQLHVRLEAVEKERDALHAKIEAMERQKPVAEWIENRFDCYPQLVWADDYKAVIGTKLYALPCAKGE